MISSLLTTSLRRRAKTGLGNFFDRTNDRLGSIPFEA